MIEKGNEWHCEVWSILWPNRPESVEAASARITVFSYSLPAKITLLSPRTGFDLKYGKRH